MNGFTKALEKWDNESAEMVWYWGKKKKKKTNILFLFPQTIFENIFAEMFIHWFGAAAPHNMNYKHHTHTHTVSMVFQYLCLFWSLRPEMHRELRGLFLTHFNTKVSQALQMKHTHTHTHPRLGNTFVIKPSPDDAKWHAALSVSQSSDNKQKPHSWLTVDNLQDQAYFFCYENHQPTSYSTLPWIII